MSRRPIERKYRTAVLSEFRAQSCRWKDLLYGSSDSERERERERMLFLSRGRNQESRPTICSRTLTRESARLFCARRATYPAFLSRINLTARARARARAVSYVSSGKREKQKYLHGMYPQGGFPVVKRNGIGRCTTDRTYPSYSVRLPFAICQHHNLENLAASRRDANARHLAPTCSVE